MTSSQESEELLFHLQQLLPHTYHALVMAPLGEAPQHHWHWVIHRMRDLMPETVGLWSDVQLEDFLNHTVICTHSDDGTQECGQVGFHHHCNQCGSVMHTSPQGRCMMCAIQAYRDLHT